MKLEEVKKALTNYQKGSFIRVGWTSSIESAKSRKNGITVQKLSEATVRIGIKYNNIHAVQVMRENAASGESKLDDGEFLDAEYFEKERVLDMIKRGQIRDSKTIAAVLFPV